MKKKAFLVTAAALAVALVAGGLFASNMGFKLNDPLDGPGTNGSLTGSNSLALPFNQQSNLNDALDLINDINAAAGGSVVDSVGRFVKSTDGFEGYNGLTGTPFPLVPGEGYQVKVNTNVNYIVVGSHDPGAVVALDGPGTNGSLTGSNFYSYPYHSTSANAEDLINEINAAAGASVVDSVGRFVKTTDGFEGYNGLTGTPFALIPGESYSVKVNTDVAFVPSHF